jgi:hypothetical protein
MPDRIYRDESWRMAQMAQEHARFTALEAYVRAENARRQLLRLIAVLSCVCLGLAMCVAVMIVID